MDIIQKLPDDIIIYIYTKILKKYRLHEKKLIKLIDFEKYKFLEKYIYRKIVNLCELHFGDNESIEYEIKYKLNNFDQISNRKDLLIDDDMICINLTLKENTIKYEINRFKLKKIEDLTIFNKPSIYFKGNLTEYDWEVVSYIYEI